MKISVKDVISIIDIDKVRLSLSNNIDKQIIKFCELVIIAQSFSFPANKIYYYWKFSCFIIC